MRYILVSSFFFLLIPVLSSQLNIGIDFTYNSFLHETYYNEVETDKYTWLPLDSIALPTKGFGLGLQLTYDHKLFQNFGLSYYLGIGRYSRPLTIRGKIPNQEGFFEDVSLAALYIKPSICINYTIGKISVFGGYSFIKFASIRFKSLGESYKIPRENLWENFYNLIHGPILGAKVNIYKNYTLSFSYTRIIPTQRHHYGNGFEGFFFKDNMFNFGISQHFRSTSRSQG